ncbi:hypothetical protein NMY22_g1293 [Coprinellus aureogranulatus]|nr:hypothetical protein NMY22_g1293 [Coprinellus aureogranulatus]
MASVSRSSGLEKGGDDLKDFKIQEEYREFVHEKFSQLVKRHYPRRFIHENKREKEHRIEEQENVLIIFRKLREGVMASKRNDAFALEVYETSLYLSIIFESPKQPPSIIPHLIPTVYKTATCPQPLRLATIILSLLYHLATTYPSQTTYRKHLETIPTEHLPRDSKAFRWLSSLVRSLRTRNYAQFDRLSRTSNLVEILGGQVGGLLMIESLTKSPRADASRELAHNAILTVLHTLRTKARETFWAVLRSAYNELACTPNAGDSKQWLTRSLVMQSPLSEDLTLEAEAWLEEQARTGQVLPKEGVKGRYLCRFRR